MEREKNISTNVYKHRSTTEPGTSPPAWFAGGGAMGELVRSIDWSKTLLGAIEHWPTSLRSIVRVVLNNRFLMLVWWGRDLINIYNDAYVPTLGDKHPRAMSMSARDVWRDTWHILGPKADSVLDGAPATWDENLGLILYRRGFPEETRWTFSYSPVFDDVGRVGGLLVTAQETTRQVQDARQLQTLRELGERSSAEATKAEDACLVAAAKFAANPRDVPFSLFISLAPMENGHSSSLQAALTSRLRGAPHLCT